MLNSGLTKKDALISGMAGAATLTAVHQAARLIRDDAPRMDVMAERAAERVDEAVHHHDSTQLPAVHPSLRTLAVAGDLLFNGAYYSLATTWTRGAALGLAAGACALLLPQKLGLGNPPKSELLSNQVMTVAWYVLGGLAAAWTAQCLAEKRAEKTREFVGGY
jgi:hypothetical protein